MSYIPKFILNIIDNFNIRSVVSWFKDIINYLIAPRKFVSQYNSKSVEEQIQQLLFYILLNCLIYFTFGAGQSQQHLYRYIFIILSTSIPFIFLNTITFALISKSQFNFWKTTSYVLVGNLIFFMPLPIFLNLFIENENYTFMFIVNIFLSMSVFYFLIIFWIGIFKKLTNILAGIIINIILFNAFYLAIGFIVHDSFSKVNYSIDAIIDEFNVHGEKIEYADVKVVEYISVKQVSTNIDSCYASISVHDSILKIDQSGINLYSRALKKNQRYIDSIMPKLNFKRNKEMFKLLHHYYIDVDNFFKNPKSPNNLKEITNYTYKGESKIEFITEKYKVDKSVSLYLDKYKSMFKELEDSKDFASLPIELIEKLLFPTELIVKKFDLVTEKKVTFRIQ